ncbi:MAG: ammonia-forming cytochrome c nitrite reductase subunit c552 [Bacillota bacterium]
MTKRKALKVAIIAALAALIALAAGITVSGAKSNGGLPEYLGSKACLGCHVDKFENWAETGHAHMITQVFKFSDLPGDMNTAPEELKAELLKAAWIVAGQRFLARDPETGELKYLNVRWDPAKQQYAAYKGGANWETDCAGCHVTGWDKVTAEFADPGIGCEACHGPGRDHVLSHGELSMITATDDSQVCGQCHTGGSSSDGARWPNYKPGDDLNATGWQLPKIPDPHEGLFPSLMGYPKIRQYPLWEKSAHAKALGSPATTGHARESCFKCHAAEAFQNHLAGKPAPKDHAIYTQGVTCSACHDPHNSTHEGQLRMPANDLCIACHNGSLPEGGEMKPGSTPHHPMKEMLAGYGAIGVAKTIGAHSELSCVECHMTEGNHLMRVIKPSEVVGTTRQDSCTACHTNSTAESREVYFTMWQESVERRMEAAKNDLAVLTANLGILNADQKAKFDAAKSNLLFVEADASKGAHNFEYAIKILNNVNKTLSDLRKAIGK